MNFSAPPGTALRKNLYLFPTQTIAGQDSARRLSNFGVVRPRSAGGWAGDIMASASWYGAAGV